MRETNVPELPLTLEIVMAQAAARRAFYHEAWNASRREGDGRRRAILPEESCLFEELRGMAAAGWIKFRPIRISGERFWGLELLIHPDETGADGAPCRSPLPQACGGQKPPLPLAQAHKCLLGAAERCRDGLFVGNPDRWLANAFGSAFDTSGTVDQLAEAGLGAWRNGEGGGSTWERFFVFAPEDARSSIPPSALPLAA